MIRIYGRKWSAQAAVLDAESRLRNKDLVGVVAHGRAGLGMFPKPQRKECKGMDKRGQIQEEVRAAVEEGRSSRVAGLRQNGLDKMGLVHGPEVHLEGSLKD